MEHFPTLSMRSVYPEATTREGYHKKIKLWTNVESEILSIMLANQIQQQIKRYTHHDKVRFIPRMQGWLSIQ